MYAYAIASQMWISVPVHPSKCAKGCGGWKVRLSNNTLKVSLNITNYTNINMILEIFRILWNLNDFDLSKNTVPKI